MGQGKQPCLGAFPGPGQTFTPAQLGGRAGGVQSHWRKGSGKPSLLSSSRKSIFHVLLLLCPRSSFSWWCVGVCEGFILSPLNHCSTTSFQPFCTAEKSLMAFLLIFLLKEAASELHGATRLHPSSKLGSNTTPPCPGRGMPGGAGTPPPASWHPEIAAYGWREGTRDAAVFSAGKSQGKEKPKGRSGVGCPEHGVASPPPQEPRSKPKRYQIPITTVKSICALTGGRGGRGGAGRHCITVSEHGVCVPVFHISKRKCGGNEFCGCWHGQSHCHEQRHGHEQMLSLLNLR